MAVLDKGLKQRIVGALVLTTSLVLTLRSWRAKFGSQEPRHAGRGAADLSTELGLPTGQGVRA